MKRTHKTIIGAFGLVLVAAMTFFAGGIETPEASAVSSATDTITVRVMGDVPKVNFSQPDKNILTTNILQNLKIDYENVESIELTMVYTDKDGGSQTVTLSDPSNPKFTPDDVAGDLVQNVNLGDYGYGTFVFTVKGIGVDGVADIDILTITFAPIIGDVQVDPETGEIIIDINYDPDVIKEGEVIVCIDGDAKCYTFKIPDDIIDGKVRIPTDGLEEGEHTVTVRIIAYDKDGNPIYDTHIENNNIKFETTDVPDTNDPDGGNTEVPNTGAPDTGGLLKKLNITKEDYLITGLIVFFVFGVVAFGIVAKSRKNKR